MNIEPTIGIIGVDIHLTGEEARVALVDASEFQKQLRTALAEPGAQLARSRRPASTEIAIGPAHGLAVRHNGHSKEQPRPLGRKRAQPAPVACPVCGEMKDPRGLGRHLRTHPSAALAAVEKSAG